MQIALLENIQRENLTAIEEAEAYSNLLKVLNVTQEELANKIGKSRTYINKKENHWMKLIIQWLAVKHV